MSADLDQALRETRRLRRQIRRAARMWRGLASAPDHHVRRIHGPAVVADLPPTTLWRISAHAETDAVGPHLDRLAAALHPPEDAPRPILHLHRWTTRDTPRHP